MRYSKGVSWIDDVRIPFVDDGDKGCAKPQGKTTIIRNVLFNPTNDMVRSELETTQGQGRFPANILVSDDMLNDGVITKQNPRKYKADLDIQETSLLGFGDTKDKIQMGDKGTNSRYYDIDKWFNNLIDV
jgi:hypothetical protein